jgi:hypothetical protein
MIHALPSAKTWPENLIMASINIGEIGALCLADECSNVVKVLFILL